LGKLFLVTAIGVADIHFIKELTKSVTSHCMMLLTGSPG